ncbi:MAG TPA: DsbA family protein [Acidimicrobiia bacterium]|nr:DsbA family protein [Acidimicrobiia bacterium]
MSDGISGLIYVGDPMCSWCWGFAPEIEELAEELPVEVVVGGLRPGPMAQPLDDRMASFLSQHWVEIAERTGQPFSTEFLDRRDGWIYDTEPAAVAVTQMRELARDRTLDYFTDIQMAFYGKGEDVTDFDILTRLAEPYDVDTGAFRESLTTDEAKKAAWSDFSRARNWGISGFPTLVGELGDGRLALLARGWTEADTIRARIASVAENTS